MGTLTHLEMRTEVLSALANRDDILAADVTRVLNLMQERMARARDWEELRFNETITGTFTGVKTTDKFLNYSEFTSPNDDFKEIWSFRLITGDGESKKLTRVPVRAWDSRFPEPEFWSSGTPSFYTQWKDKFELWKIPDKAFQYALRGILWPTVLSTDGQKSDLDRKDDLLIWIAVSYLWNQKGEYQRADRFFGMFRGAFEEAAFEDHTEPDKVIAPAHQLKGFHVTPEYWLNPWVKGVD